MTKSLGKEPITSIVSLQQRNDHRTATNTGKIVQLEPRCKCCHLPYTKQGIKFSFSQSEILQMGVGIVLYFRFLFMAIIIILISSCSYSIASIVQNIRKYQQAANMDCSLNWTFHISNLNNVHKYKQMYSYIMGSLSIILLVVIPTGINIIEKILSHFYLMSSKVKYTQPLSLLFKLEKPVNCTESDVIKSINTWYEYQKQQFPAVQKMEQQVLNNEQKRQKNIVEKVYFHFNMKYVKLIEKQIQLLEAEIAKQQSLQEQYSNEINPKNKNNGQIITESGRTSKSVITKAKIQILKQKIRNKQIDQTNKFIVVFKNLFYREYFRTQLPEKFVGKNYHPIMFSGQVTASVEEAPFPNQINYDNQNVQYYHQKLKCRFFCWMFNFVVIGLGTVIQLIVIITFKNNQIFQYISPYSGFVVAVICYCISELGSKLSLIFINKEYHTNQPQKNYSNFKHIFITNIFLKCISISFMYQSSKTKQCWQGYLTQTCTWMIIITGFCLLITKICNIRILKYIYHRLDKQDEIKKNMKQQQFNKLFQKPENEIEKSYAQIVQLMLISFLYASIAPLSLLICFIFLLIYFFLQRICFIHIYKQPQPSGDCLFLNVSTIFWKYGSLCLTIGHFYFLHILNLTGKNVHSSVIILFIVILGLNIVILFFPSSLFKPTLMNNLSYDSIKQCIIFCYSQYNPFYQSELLEPGKTGKMGLTKKSDTLEQQLHVMSRSLQNTLKQKLFNIKNPCLQTLGNREELSQIYFQYDKKIEMPKKQSSKKIKLMVPPIFKTKSHKETTQDKNKMELNKTGDELIKLNTLVGFQSEKQGQKIKNIIKGAIRQSINKIQ